MQHDTSRLLNNAEAAALLSIKPNTLEIWRLQGRSPRFLKIGRSVRYRMSDLEAWLNAQTFENTSQYPRHQSQPTAAN